MRSAPRCKTICNPMRLDARALDFVHA